MTIGPEPMTATEPMSARLGNGRPIRRGATVDEPGQRLAGVVGPRAGLRVKLQRGDIPVAEGEALDGAVVERRMGHEGRAVGGLELAPRLGPPHREAVVLGR